MVALTRVAQPKTVNPAVLTLTAGNATGNYGAANPAFTYAITGEHGLAGARAGRGPVRV
jgi:hypothetical protein